MSHVTKAAAMASIIALPLLSGTASAATVYQAEFNTDGNAQGWAGATATPNISGLNVAGGTLNGTATNGDPRLGVSGLSVSLSAPDTAWESVTFRVREYEPATTSYVTAFDATGLVLQVNGSTPAGTTFSAVTSDADFLIVTANLSGLPAATTITALRLDPIGGGDATGNTFEVDYIRVNAIPEPASLGLLGLGGLFLGRRRGR